MPSEFVKTILALRPPTSADPAGQLGTCFEIKDGNTLTIPTLPNCGIFQPNTVVKEGSDTQAVWDIFGKDLIHRFTDVGAAKSHHLVSVWGSDGSGKSYVARGLKAGADTEPYNSNSIIGKITEEMALLEDVLLCVWLFHQDSIVDLSTGTDHMKPKVEDGVATIDNTGGIKITSTAAAQEFFQKCLDKRKEFFDKSGSSEAMCHLVVQFVLNGSSLTVIEHAAAFLHTPLPSLTADQKKQLEEKAKVSTHIMKLWVDSANSADQKALAWKDTKLGRFMQPGLGAAMDGTGVAVLVVCAANVMAHTYESLVAAQFVTSATKLDGLKSVSEYKLMIEEVEERLGSRTKELPALKTQSTAEEAEAVKVKAANEARIAELNNILRELDMKIANANAQSLKDKEKAQADHDTKVAQHNKKCADEVDRMKNLSSNAPAQAAEDIRKRNAEVDAEYKEKVKAVHEEIAGIQKAIKAHKDALSDMVRTKNNRQKEEVDSMIPVKEKERELQRHQASLALAGKCREDGLSENEIIERQPMWEARDEVDELEAKAFAVAYELMALEQGFENGVGKPKADGEVASDSEPDSDEDSSDESSVESEETPSEKAAREEEERLEREEEERERQEEIERERYAFEWEHFRDTVKKDVFLSETVEAIGKYLAYGTAATILDPKTGEFSRQYLFLMKHNKGIGITKVPQKDAEPDRRHPVRVIPFENCDGLHLGQHSPLFNHQLRSVGARKGVDRNFIPDDFTKINLYTFHEYYYRSMSVQHHENLFLDIIFDSATDFEAFIVYIHRHCNLPVGWGKKLNVEMCDDQEKLRPHEREMCEELHLLPIDFMNLRDALLRDNRRLFLTLHDIRSKSGLDLYHCQRMLETFLKRRWLVRKQLNYLRFQEDELEEDEQTPLPKRPSYIMEAKHAIEELEPIPLQRAADKAEQKAVTGESSSSSDEEGEEGDQPKEVHADPTAPGMLEDDDDLMLGPSPTVASAGRPGLGAGLLDDDDDDILLGPKGGAVPPTHNPRAGLLDDDEDLNL